MIFVFRCVEFFNDRSQSEIKVLAFKIMLAKVWHGAMGGNELKKSSCLCCATSTLFAAKQNKAKRKHWGLPHGSTFLSKMSHTLQIHTCAESAAAALGCRISAGMAELAELCSDHSLKETL